MFYTQMFMRKRNLMSKQADILDLLKEKQFHLPRNDVL